MHNSRSLIQVRGSLEHHRRDLIPLNEREVVELKSKRFLDGGTDKVKEEWKAAREGGV